MTNIPLRAYTREIEALIEREQRLEEAIAHCRQILKTYPKHLGTYRLLGKAYLEGKRYDQAVDIFERLLVAVPDDFVAHVGMSIIADDQGKLDDAIWHMERAFEVQPSNAAIQGELQRLFGRRDGVEPPKIRLTRGALAHMYVQGQLYTQAISEIRAVLAQDPERADLQVLLAKACFHGGQKNEAADVCTQLLSRYPYCFDANGLMVDLVAGTPSADSAPEYRQRVIELEPYAAFTQGSVFGTASVPENSVMLERLDYVAEAPQAAAVVASGLASTAAPGISPWSAFASRDQPGKDLPPFLRAEGSKAAGTASPQPLEGAPLSETPSGDLPAWVKALAPTDDDETTEASEPNPPQALTWLRPEDTLEGPQSSAFVDGIPDSETPAWLKDLGGEIDEPTAAAGSAEPGPTAGQDEPVPPAESGSLSAASQEEDDGLGWLESLAPKHEGTPDETMTSTESPATEPPSWMDKAAEIGQQAADAWTAIAEESGEQPPEAAESTVAPAEPGNSGSTPPAEFLHRLAEPASAESSLPESFSQQPPAEAPAGEAPAAEAPAAEWLQALAESDTARSTTPESSAEVPAPDWLEELAGQGAISDQADAGAGQAVPSSSEGLLSEWPKMTPPPAVGDEPTWLGGVTPEPGASSPPVSAGSPADSGAEADLPDWLSGMDKAKSTIASTPPSEGPPAWLQTESEQVLQPAEQTSAADWRPAEAELPSAVAPETPDSGTSAAQLGAPAIVGIPAGPESGPLPRPPKPGAAVLGSAQSEMGRGNIAAALDIYGRLIRRGKSLTEIIRDLRDALTRYPVEVPLWQALGDAYMRSNRLQEALDAYTRAEELLR